MKKDKVTVEVAVEMFKKLPPKSQEKIIRIISKENRPA